jgi:hypothetical protein
MTTKTKVPRKMWHLDKDGRLSPRACGLRWRVVAADQDRVDPAVDYLFCPPDFLFPVDGVARALRLEVDPRPAAERRPVAAAGAPRRAGRASRWADAMSPRE